MRHIDGGLKLDYDHVPPTQRINDQHVMKIVVEKMTVVKEIVVVNHVRLHLKIIAMSDMANAAGDKLDVTMCCNRGGNWSSKCTSPFI